MIVASNNITLSNVNDGSTPYVHIAYANSADGTDGFYVSGGGTNLLIGTSEGEKSGKSYWIHDYQISGGLQPNTTYTLSGWARVDQKAMDNQQHVFVCAYTEDWSWSGWLNIDGSLTAKYNKVTFTTPSGKPFNSTVSVYLSHPNGDSSKDSISGTGYINKLKLEKGSVATPWCPAPSEAHPTYMGTYTDYNQSASYDPTKYQWSLIKGADGKDGTPGKDGVGIKSTIITYQLSSSGTTTPTGTWSATVPTLVKGQYLWTRTTLVYTDNTTKDVYTVSYVAKDGNNGTDGVAGKDGVGIKSTNITYQASTSGTTAPTGTWVANPPSVADGNYLWTRTVWNYTDGTSETGYSVAKIGEKGDKGDQGIQGPPGADGKTSYLHIAYANSADGKTGFTTSPDTKISYNYMGTYTDYTQAGSTDPTNYTWVAMFDSTKKRNFTTTPTTPYAVGDTWIDRGSATYFCINSRDSGPFDSNDWKMQQLTIQSLDSNIQTDLNNSVKTTGNYKGVTLNDAGLTATAGGTTVAMNSNDGFIINNLKHNSADNPGGQVFHVDTDGNLTISGNLTAGNSPTATISGVNFTGQSLTLTGYLKLTGDNSAISSSGGDVVFNKNGIIATSTSGTTTVAIDGTNSPLRIQHNNNDIFKVDNDGNLAIKGDLSAGDSPNSTISGVNFTGDNLTLTGSLKLIPASDGTNGAISFADGHGTLDENGLSLQAVKEGTILSISDQYGKQTTYIRDDGTLFANGGEFTGIVHAEQLNLTGDDPSIDVGGGTFHVNSKGQVTANNFTSTNVKITGGIFETGAIESANISSTTITGGNIIGATVTSARFESSGREFSSGAYYPVSDSIYTPSYSTSEEGTINVHSVFPQAFSTVARIGANNKGIDAPYVNITNEAFDRNTASGSIGYGKGYEYPVPYLYGQQGGMPTYPVDSNELSIVWMNDIDQSEDNYGVYDGYKYTEIATIHDIVAKYASKKGRIKLNFGIVCSYDSYDIQNSDWSAGGLHNLYLVLTEGRINGNDTYHIDPGGTTFNNVNNNIKIKMVSKKILTDVTGLSFYNLYAELSTQDLDPVDVYYLGVLQKGFYKSQSKDSNHTWKIQLDGIAVIPDSDILDDQKYYDPLVDGSYRNLAVSGNGSIIAHEEGAEYETTSEYNSTYISFSNYQKGGFPYWTTMSADGIGFSIGNNSASKDGAGNDNGLQTRQCIYFSGDNNYDGMSMDNYGNVHGQVGSGVWRVYNNQGNEVLDVPFDPNGVFNFNVPQSNWGGLKIGWVKFDAWSSADKVPALYNDHDHIKGLALWDRYVVTFIDGFAWNMTDRNGIVANHENVMSTHLLS